ncbi:MAG: Lipoate synthase [uncultured Sulfurovum sp.]|uniref:Lipoyl synthase n=1 Tax=uncultured Sulfurovum sp. TaxID=269237 RepID=A0A6S6TF63_9BACT|nr:MAG: Lipoate synthase [uncultured Sulfurovum sp.]
MLLDPEKRERKPEWLRKKISFSAQKDMDQLLNENGIHTICQEAKCPNISECFAAKTATFLILGGICTRRCTYCNVTTGSPDSVNKEEINQVTDAVKQLGLKFVVITSPARDDLKDGGAEQFLEVTQNVLKEVPGTQVELLVPDFLGNLDSIKTVANSGAVIVGHNMETVPRLYNIRKASVYERSLDVLAEIKKQAPENVKTKSAIMLGLGETKEEVVGVFKDLLEVGCKLLSVGQYLAPSNEYEKVVEYVTPLQFAEYKQIALDMGFEYVHSSPYARSSYMAHEYVE